jgi:hypothetical protein
VPPTAAAPTTGATAASGPLRKRATRKRKTRECRDKANVHRLHVCLRVIDFKIQVGS